MSRIQKPARLMLAAAALLTAGLAAAPRAQPLDAVTQQLATRFGFTAAERDTLTGGFETARALPSPFPDGVAAMGAVWIEARPDRYLRWAEEAADFDQGSAVQAAHRLSDPPVLSDFDGLTLSSDELRDLSRCRIGACTMQLDAGSISRVAAIDWRRSDAGAQATAIVRAMMLDVAVGYSAGGPAGLPHYHDARRATDVEENLAALLNEEEADGRAPPALFAFLREYPAPAPPRSTSYLYWTTNGFGLKPTTRLNHTVVYRGDGGNAVAGIIATTQLYASHYLHGALDMRYVVANPALDDRFVLVMLTRTRSDGLTGVTGALIGGTIRRRALHSLRAYLRFTKYAVEKRQRMGWTASTERP